MGFGGAWDLEGRAASRRARWGCRLLAVAGALAALEPVLTLDQFPGPSGVWLALGLVLGAGLLAWVDAARARERAAAGTTLVVDDDGLAWLHEPPAPPRPMTVAAFHRRPDGAWLGLACRASGGGEPVSGSASACDDRSGAALRAWLVWLRRDGAR